MVRLGAALIVGALLTAAPAGAACRLALLLALDISSSVNPAEDALQRAGLAAALIAPEVQAEILATPEAPVALAVYEWSGRYQQDMVLDWQLLDSAAAILAAAERIARSQRSYAEFPTAMGYGLGYGARLFQDAPDCLYRTLDISGDGVNNDGFGPELAYRNFPFKGITVNGLAIGGATDNDAEVFAFYRDEVIRGPGAFVETASDFADFERAMQRKLQRELAARVYGGTPVLPGGG